MTPHSLTYRDLHPVRSRVGRWCVVVATIVTWGFVLWRVANG